MAIRTLTVSRLALAAAAGVIGLFGNGNFSFQQPAGLVTQADARVGRPATPVSVAGAARRTERRAIRRGAVAAGAAVGAATYYGAAGDDADDAYVADGEVYEDPGAASAPGYEPEPVTGYEPEPVTGYESGPVTGYAPGPVPGSVIVNPTTGRWCRFEPSGWHWCWTP
jgi:hypothetical protein